MTIVDPYRVRFTLHEPWPDFMTFYGTFATSAGWIAPKKYMEQVGPDGFKKAPVGLGPYKFVSHTPGVELVMEAYEGYWRKTPSVKRIVYKSVPEATTRLAMLKRGEVDIAYLFDGPMAEEVKRDPNLKLAFSGGIGITYVDFTFSAPKSVSLAMALAPTEAERHMIVGAHRDAWMSAMAHLETIIARARKGKAGSKGSVPGRLGWVSHAGERLGADLVCPRSGRRYREAGPDRIEEVV